MNPLECEKCFYGKDAFAIALVAALDRAERLRKLCAERPGCDAPAGAFGKWLDKIDSAGRGEV